MVDIFFPGVCLIVVFFLCVLSGNYCLKVKREVDISDAVGESKTCSGVGVMVQALLHS